MEKMCSITGQKVQKLCWKLVVSIECGLLWNKVIKFLITSLDGQLVRKYFQDDWYEPGDEDSNSSDDLSFE